jgi:hypothetical protein
MRRSDCRVLFNRACYHPPRRDSTIIQIRLLGAYCLRVIPAEAGIHVP